MQQIFAAMAASFGLQASEPAQDASPIIDQREPAVSSFTLTPEARRTFQESHDSNGVLVLQDFAAGLGADFSVHANGGGFWKVGEAGDMSWGLYYSNIEAPPAAHFCGYNFGLQNQQAVTFALKRQF